MIMEILSQTQDNAYVNLTLQFYKFLNKSL